MKVLVSACLMGRNCKYNGKNNLNQNIVDFLKDKEIIEICPEVLAGMPAPRKPVEIVDGLIMTADGEHLHEAYLKGVQTALEQIKDEDITLAILQSRSPTCGVNSIYDGTFSGKLMNGQGIFAKALKERGIKVIDVEDFAVII